MSKEIMTQYNSRISNLPNPLNPSEGHMNDIRDSNALIANVWKLKKVVCMCSIPQE